MKNYYFFFIVVFLISALLIRCAKPIEKEIRKPSLYITLKTDSGKSVPGATVRLYKNINDPGITQVSDSTGVVIFHELEIAQYHWLAEKGCKTNRISQTTLNRPMVANGILYGYSVMAETGTLKVVNNSPESYKVSDSLFNITINKDTPYIGHRRVRSYLIRSEKISTPGIGKDTLIKIKCGDTLVLNIPY